MIWAVRTGKIDWSGLAHALSGNDGVHICTTDHYDLDNVACTTDDSTITALSQARLVISQQAAFVANGFTMVLSTDNGDRALTQVCSTTLSGAPGYNKVAFHLDQVISQCGTHLQHGTTYQAEIDQDTETVGTTTFTYGLVAGAATSGAPGRANVVYRAIGLTDLYKVAVGAYNDCAHHIQALFGKEVPPTSQVQTAHSQCILDNHVTQGIAVPTSLRSSPTVMSYLDHTHVFEQTAVRLAEETLAYRAGSTSFAQANQVGESLIKRLNSESTAVDFLGGRIRGRILYDERHRHR